MAKWLQNIGGRSEKKADQNFMKNRSLRAYELFKKNKYKQTNEQSLGDSSTNKEGLK